MTQVEGSGKLEEINSLRELGRVLRERRKQVSASAKNLGEKLHEKGLLPKTAGQYIIQFENGVLFRLKRGMSMYNHFTHYLSAIGIGGEERDVLLKKISELQEMDKKEQNVQMRSDLRERLLSESPDLITAKGFVYKFPKMYDQENGRPGMQLKKWLDEKRSQNEYDVNNLVIGPWNGSDWVKECVLKHGGNKALSLDETVVIAELFVDMYNGYTEWRKEQRRQLNKIVEEQGLEYFQRRVPHEVVFMGCLGTPVGPGNHLMSSLDETVAAVEAKLQMLKAGGYFTAEIIIERIEHARGVYFAEGECTRTYMNELLTQKISKETSE